MLHAGLLSTPLHSSSLLASFFVAVASTHCNQTHSTAGRMGSRAGGKDVRGTELSQVKGPCAHWRASFSAAVPSSTSALPHSVSSTSLSDSSSQMQLPCAVSPAHTRRQLQVAQDTPSAAANLAADFAAADATATAESCASSEHSHAHAQSDEGSAQMMHAPGHVGLHNQGATWSIAQNSLCPPRWLLVTHSCSLSSLLPQTLLLVVFSPLVIAHITRCCLKLFSSLQLPQLTSSGVVPYAGGATTRLAVEAEAGGEQQRQWRVIGSSD